MQLVRKYTTAAHSPRGDAREVLYREAKLDLAYSIHSRELPKGPPSGDKFNVVFVHGVQYTKEGWYYWIDRLLELFGDKIDKCIAIDHVHHGESAILNEGKVGFFVRWDELGRDVAQVIQDCRRRGEIADSAPTFVVGHSMGAVSSMCMSVFEPSLVTGLVLVDPVWMGPMFPHGSESPMTGKFGRLAHSSYKRNRDTFDSYEEYRDFMENKSIYADVHPQVKKDVIDNLWAPSPTGKGVRTKMNRAQQAAGYYAGLSIFGLAESLVKRVHVPTYIIHGDTYDFNPEGLQEALEEHIAGSKRTIIPGGGHMVCYTHPDQCIDTIKDFLQTEAEKKYEVNKMNDAKWGGTAEEKFLAEVDLRLKGDRNPYFSKL